MSDPLDIPDFLLARERAPLTPEQQAEFRRLRALDQQQPGGRGRKHDYSLPRTAPPPAMRAALLAAAAAEQALYRVSSVPPRPPKRT